MSEQFIHHEEHKRYTEPEKPVEQAETSSNLTKETRHDNPEQKLDTIEAIHDRIEKQALSGKETPVEKTSELTNHEQFYVTKDLKLLSYQRSLTRLRKRLSAPDKLLSKIVHQPVVDSLSQVGAKTIARPASLLGGAFFALVGTSFAFYMAKHYGFRYNLLLFFILFLGGFVVGTVFELIINLIRRLHKR